LLKPRTRGRGFGHKRLYNCFLPWLAEADRRRRL
jgi:hypothetical protein